MQSTNRFSLRSFRLLIVVGGVAIVVGSWEVSHRSTPADLYLAPGNFSDTVNALYPNAAQSHYLRTRQILMCLQTYVELGYTSPQCERFLEHNPTELARRHFESGMAGSKHIEELYYNYILFLQGVDASRTHVDAAYHEWKRKFPLSIRPDPRSIEGVVLPSPFSGSFPEPRTRNLHVRETVTNP